MTTTATTNNPTSATTPMATAVTAAPAVDLRLGALRRFAIAISVLNLLGHTVLGFEQSWAYPFASLFTAYSLDILLETISAWSRGHKPLYLGGGFLGLVDFLLPAHISGLAVSMLLYSNAELFPIVFAATVAVSSKYIFRVQMGKNGRHFMNPSNFGITATILLIHWVGVAPGYNFTEKTGGIVDWILPLIIICTGSLLNGLFTKKFPLILSWLGGFILQATVRHFLFGTNIYASLSMMTGLAFVLFTFYMISDPGTTPFPVKSQIGFGLSVAAVYGLLMIFHVVYAIFIALTIVCAIRGINLYLQNRPTAQPHLAKA